jgi:hypothetical protein
LLAEECYVGQVSAFIDPTDQIRCVDRFFLVKRAGFREPRPPSCGRKRRLNIQPMIDFARQRLRKLGLTNVAFHHAGFLTYEHRDEHASSVITKFALHHLPDFWKVVALVRINRFLQMGGLFYLEDVVFSFQPESYRTAIQQWIDQASASGESFSEKDFEGHVRDEYSTYSWTWRQ